MAPKLPKMISTFFEYLTAQYCQNIHYMSYGSYYPFQLDQMIQRACCMIVLVSYLLPALICWTAVSWKSCTAITFGLQRKLPPPINPREKSETKFQVIWELCIITKSSNCDKGQQFQVKNRMVLQSMRGIKVSICRGKNLNFKSIEIIKNPVWDPYVQQFLGRNQFFVLCQKSMGDTADQVLTFLKEWVLCLSFSPPPHLHDLSEFPVAIFNVRVEICPEEINFVVGWLSKVDVLVIFSNSLAWQQ